MLRVQQQQFNYASPLKPADRPMEGSDSMGTAVCSDDVRPAPTPGKPLSVFAALFGECMCADAFRVRPSDLRRGRGDDKSPAARTPFLVLGGVEVVSLGAVERPGGHSPRERVRETAAQLATDPARLVGVGCLVEDGGGILKGGERESAASSTPAPGMDGNKVLGWASSDSSGDMDEERAKDFLQDVKEEAAVGRPLSPMSGGVGSGPFVKADLVPLEVYEETYPGDLEQSLSKPARDALSGIRSGDFDASYRGFERMAKAQKAQMKKGPPRGGGINDGAYLAGINVHNMAVCRLLAGTARAAAAGGGEGAAPEEEQALLLFREAADLKRASFGPFHPELAATLVEVGVQCFAADDPDAAASALNEARKIRSAALGSDHPKVAVTLNNMGCVYFQQRSNVAALTCFQEAKDIQQRAMETGRGAMRVEMDLLHVATTLCNLAYMKFRLKDYEEARAIFEDALLVQQSVLGDNHQTIKDTLSNIALANAFHS